MSVFKIGWMKALGVMCILCIIFASNQYVVMLSLVFLALIAILEFFCKMGVIAGKDRKSGGEKN